MSVTLNALYYINAWNAGADVSHGMAYRDALQKCRLDYSVASLGRIDALLDVLRITRKPVREAFLAQDENQNLLYYLAFYAGEVVGRTLAAPPQWLSYQDAVALAPSHQTMFSDCFENSICCRFPDDRTAQADFFNPLYALVSRLMSANSGKSIRFSAGLFFPARFDAEPLASKPAPPLAPGLFGEAFTLPAASKRERYPIIRPWWGDGHKISYMLDSAALLLDEGRVVWGATVQANMALFSPEYCIGAMGDVLYDPAGRLPPGDLVQVATALAALKGTQAGEAGLKAIAEHLTTETTPAFGLDVPASVCPQPLKLSTTYFDQVFLPDGMLTLRWYPILISDQCPGAVLVLPWQLWPAKFVEQWRHQSEAIHGQRVDSRDWKRLYDNSLAQETERRAMPAHALDPDQFYKEGLLYFHGRGFARDYAKARRLWEQAAELGEANSMNNLGIVHEQGLGVPANTQKAISYYLRAAESGHPLAQLNLGKTYLRDAKSGIDVADAKRWLQMAARQGNDEAVSLLLQNFGR